MSDERPHVLVIGDEADALELLDAQLSRVGCRVDRATNGQDGMARALVEPPDIVILDLHLPGIDGREMTRRLRADPRTAGCRIVLASVLNPQDIEDTAIDAVLAKPFRRASVASLMQVLTPARAQGER